MAEKICADAQHTEEADTNLLTVHQQQDQIWLRSSQAQLLLLWMWMLQLTFLKHQRSPCNRLILLTSEVRLPGRAQPWAGRVGHQAGARSGSEQYFCISKAAGSNQAHTAKS